MGRYPAIDPDKEYLDPRNPFYQDVIDASNALSKAERDWYKRRRDVFNQYDFGDFDETDGDVEKKYDSFCGPDPWMYQARFASINPDRPTGGSYRLVQDQFSLSEIEDGFADDVFVENGEDDDSYCGGERYVLPQNRKDDDCDDDPAPRVLRYHEGRGKGSVDCLYYNLAAFKSKNTTTGLRYYEETGDDDDPYDPVDVYTRFGETPYAWKAKDGYGQQALSAMKAAGDDYEEQVRPYLKDYLDALDDYNKKGGGELNFDYLNGTIAEPWDGYDGDDVSYNRPGDLPARLVRQIRGVPKVGD